MVKKIFYEKVGRRYVPVSEYNNEFVDSFKKGTHIVMCYPGGQSRRYNIDPDYAGLIAAGRVAEDAMTEAIQKASELRPQQTPITEAQQQAWKNLAKAFGDELTLLHWSSAYDIAQAGLKALQQQADVLYSNPAVRDAYEHFLFVCALTKQKQE